jgi:hypothetical protein
MRLINKILDTFRIKYYCFELFARSLLTIRKDKLIIHVYTLCWNEEKLLPFFLDYYSDIVDRINIYDNYSTDNSERIMKQYKNVKVFKYNSDNKINDFLYLNIKNNAWKASRGKADFVIVCDTDEFLYSEDLFQTLKYLKKNRHTVIKPFGYQMVSEFLPEYTKDKRITDIVKTGYSDNMWLSKSIIFDPNSIVEINYSPGCHECSPTGNVKFYHADKIKLLHYKYLGFEYQIQRMKNMGSRLSKINIENGWGTYYLENTTIEGLKALMKKTYKVI